MSAASRPPTRPYSRPAYPTLQSSSSTASSSYQSSSNLSTFNSPSPASSAPLPSPSASHSQHQGFFNSLAPQQQQQQGQIQYQQFQQFQQPQQQYQASSASVQRQPASFEYRPNRDGAGRTATETNNLLGEYALLAEAAKRAEMAVLMRDMEGVEL